MFLLVKLHIDMSLEAVLPGPQKALYVMLCYVMLCHNKFLIHARAEGVVDRCKNFLLTSLITMGNLVVVSFRAVVCRSSQKLECCDLAPWINSKIHNVHARFHINHYVTGIK